MQRRNFLKMLAAVPALSGCAYLRIDPYSVLIRSDIIRSAEDEQKILKNARVGYTDNGRVRVMYVRGSAYERGYQHGVLLRKEVQENLGYLYKNSLKTFREPEIFAEAYERMRPFIPQEYVDEMHGLAHGSRLPLEVIHHIHALPSMTEWGGKKRIKDVVMKMMAGVDLGTSCSNIGMSKSATKDGQTYAVRVLDWGLHRISKLHEYPLITVGVPDKGIPYANIGWVGFIGAISGLNAQGITLGEMGYGSPDNETLAGKPMPFLLRDVMTYAANLQDVRRIIKDSPGDNSFVFVMSDGKSKETELYIKDHDRFLAFQPGKDLSDGKEQLKGLPDLVYGGHDNKTITALLTQYHGQLTPELFMQEIVPKIAMKSNFQNVIYDPGKLRFWVSSALNKNARAAEQPYTYFDFAAALKSFG